MKELSKFALDSYSSDDAYPTWALGPRLENAAEAIAEYAQAPVEIAVHSVLAAASLCAQQLYDAQRVMSRNGMPCSLNLLTQAASGDRKSTCDRMALEAIKEIERKQMIEHAARARGVRDRIPGVPRRLFAEPTYEYISTHFVTGGYASIGLFSDEGGGFLGGHSMKSETRQAAVSGLTSIWDSGKVERLRRTDGDMAGAVTNRRMSVHLMAQPVALQRTLSDAYLQGQGFLARMLILAPLSLAGTRLLSVDQMNRRAEDDQRLIEYQDRVKEIMGQPLALDDQGGLILRVIPMSRPALKLWVEAVNELELLQAEGQDFSGTMRPFAGRFGELTTRVATVISAFEGHIEIKPDVMFGSIEIVRRSLVTWHRLLEESQTVQVTDEAERLLKFLHAKPSIRTLKEVMQYGPRPRSKERFEPLLGVLAERGKIELSESGKSFSVVCA